MQDDLRLPIGGEKEADSAVEAGDHIQVFIAISIQGNGGVAVPLFHDDVFLPGRMGGSEVGS